MSFFVVDPPKKLTSIVIFPQKDPRGLRTDDVIYVQRLTKTSKNRTKLVTTAYDKIAHEMGPRKYLNTLKYQRIDQTNIQINSDAQELTEQISEYIWIKKNQLRI